MLPCNYHSMLSQHGTSCRLRHLDWHAYTESDDFINASEGLFSFALCLWGQT